MPDQAGEKTQDPTPHRRQQAREQGQVAFSQDLGSALILLIGTALILWMGGRIAHSLARLTREHLGGNAWITADPAGLVARLRAIGEVMLTALAPILGILLVGAILSSILQVGFLFVPSRLAPDLGKISPLRGMKRIFSLSGLMRLSFGMFKVSIIVIVAGFAIWHRHDEVLGLSQLSVPQIAMLITDLLLKTTLWVGLALLILALLDYSYQKWKHSQDLRMTPQEVREELKNLQGDPQIIARRKAVQRQMLANRIVDSVPKADVIVTNPTELAVAIQYDPATMAAPVVVAKGAGTMAERIRNIARENDVPIVERKPLARLLFREVEINHPVPNESFAAVAEVLAYVYQLKGKQLAA